LIKNAIYQKLKDCLELLQINENVHYIVNKAFVLNLKLANKLLNIIFYVKIVIQPIEYQKEN